MRTVDRTNWPEGPWNLEPDEARFVHAGYHCLILRNNLGAWCGYVAVPPGHPWHGQKYDDVPASVHGGLTFASECHGDICHVPAPGEPDDVWWVGFDCGHYNDLMPGMVALEATVLKDIQTFGAEEGLAARWRGEYRTQDYVTSETQELAIQARAATGAALNLATHLLAIAQGS